MMKLPKYLLGQAAGSLSASHIIIMFDVIGVTAPGNDNTLALALLDQTPATCTKVDASLDQVRMALIGGWLQTIAVPQFQEEVKMPTLAATSVW